MMVNDATSWTTMTPTDEAYGDGNIVVGAVRLATGSPHADHDARPA